jgi:protein-disulfide isomerase
MVFRDFPLTDIHPGAVLAAHVANCSAEQGTFWQMHTRIFEGQLAREWGGGGLADLETFQSYAADLGMDSGALRACVESNRYAGQIEDDVRSALDLGIRSTPSFVINGRPLIGAQPFEAFQRAFDRILESR